jgi:hypothetical protein
MYPELLSAVAAERRRDMVLAAERRRDLTAASAAARRSPAAREHARHRALPRFHVSWTGTTLAGVADRRRARSLVIVISATRTR